jgi:putative ABC transport system ATP-binding protein
MIELTALTKAFTLGDQIVRAVDAVDLHIDQGEYLSVMGPSGSGKSTLLNIIALLDRPSEGTYRLDGTDITELDDDATAALRQQRIGFIFQFFHLIARMTAAQNVELPMVLAGIAPAERRERVAAALEGLGLADRAHHRPDELSGGQRQRVAIARATIMRPRILLADEPTGNLDSASGAQVVEILEGLHREQGMTLLVVTHDPALGKRATRRIRIVDGRIERDERN